MATIQKRKSHGQVYWYIVESRRINGKPRPITLQYLGKAEDLLQRLTGQKQFEFKSYSHGDTHALIQIARELDIVSIINKHIPLQKDNSKPLRDGLTVGATLLLAAIGRACHPTSKMGWHEWCLETSMEYCLKNSFKKLDSQHFWDQMNCVPVDAISLMEEEILKNVLDKYPIRLDSLFYDTTNFFTFIDSQNKHCDIPRRGKNKQKRIDLRQIGMALLVSREGQFPLFHKIYEGNKNDFTIFKEIFEPLSARLKQITHELKDITLIFDKGNNSKENFKKIDGNQELHYVAGLVPSHFKDLIREANKNFSVMEIEEEKIPVYRIKTEIWGLDRTCIVTISRQLKEGQIQGIHQHLENKYKDLEEFKKQLENPKRRKKFTESDIKERLSHIIRGQFIEDILKYDLIKIDQDDFSFTYALDQKAFDQLKEEVLGRKIVVTNRHDWNNEEILQAYIGQSNIEHTFRNLKNPFHLAIRPQYHWTDQKLTVHFFICVISYLLTVIAYYKAKKEIGYSKNIDHLMNELHSIRLTSKIEKHPNRKGQSKINYVLEKIPEDIEPLCAVFDISNENIRQKIPSFSVYN